MREAVTHTAGRSIVLHLGPGLAMLLVYAGLAPWVVELGFPPLMASFLTIPIVLVPWMCGWLAREGKQITGRCDILAAVAYRQPLSRWQYAALGMPLIVWGALVFQVADTTVTPVLAAGLAPWLPDWFVAPAEFDEIVALPAMHLVLFLAAFLVLAGVVAPVVEELYFRGYLLPAVSRYGVWAPVLTVALFTLYHFESPWENPARFLMVLPLAVVVWRTRSVQVGVIVHVALNTLAALALTIAVLAARGGG